MHTARIDDLANQVRTRRRAPKGCPLTDLEVLDQAHLLHPLVEWRKHEEGGPRIVTGGRGIRLRLEDGSEVIDGLSGLVEINVGHGRTEIRGAVAAQMGACLLEELRERFGNEPVAGEIRGAGLDCAIEWTRPGGNEPVGGMMEFPEAITQAAWKRGSIVRAFWDSTGIAPPLCVTRDEIDEIVAILGESYEAEKDDFPI